MMYIRQAAPAWFVLVAIFLLLWGLGGCYACVQQFRLGAAAMGAPTAYESALYASLPRWYNAVYAVAVGTGFLGALALLLRSALSRPLYAVSIFAIVVQFGWLFATTDIILTKGLWVTAFPLLILAIAILAFRLAGHARRRGWIR